jgi:hypothetical protein
MLLPPGPQRVFGIGDTNLSVKYNFYQERDGPRLPGMAVAVNFEIPTGDANRQLGSGLSDVTVNGILQKSITKRTKLRANTGFIFSGNRSTGNPRFLPAPYSTLRSTLSVRGTTARF